MKTSSILTVFTLFAVLQGCASFPRAKTFETGKPLSGNGIVFGSIDDWDAPMGVGITFKNLDSGAIQGVVGAKRFAIELPAGRYELNEVGGRARNIKPLDPHPGIRFAVQSEQTVYLGSIVRQFLGEKHTACDATLFASPEKVKPLAYFPYVGYNKGFMDMGSISEIDDDRWCFLLFDNLATDFEALKLARSGINIRRVIRPTRAHP